MPCRRTAVVILVAALVGFTSLVTSAQTPATRSEAAKNAFMRQTGYPDGRPGYVIDHICPLVCCGLDAPQNMQWQTERASKAKDRWERSCVTCQPGTPTGQDGRRPR